MQGILVVGGHGYGNSLSQLKYPQGVIVDKYYIIYVLASENHRLVCWPRGAGQGTVVVGENCAGDASNQMRCPCRLAFDQNDKLCVCDSGNERIIKFNIDQS